jgi:hypothetical protein
VARFSFPYGSHHRRSRSRAREPQGTDVLFRPRSKHQNIAAADNQLTAAGMVSADEAFAGKCLKRGPSASSLLAVRSTPTLERGRLARKALLSTSNRPVGRTANTPSSGGSVQTCSLQAPVQPASALGHVGVSVHGSGNKRTWHLVLDLALGDQGRISPRHAVLDWHCCACSGCRCLVIRSFCGLDLKEAHMARVQARVRFQRCGLTGPIRARTRESEAKGVSDLRALGQRESESNQGRVRLALDPGVRVQQGRVRLGAGPRARVQGRVRSGKAFT